MTKPRKTLQERILDADIRAGMYLGNANEAYERGDAAHGDALYAKSQFWLDRLNLLTNQADKRAPKR